MKSKLMPVIVAGLLAAPQMVFAQEGMKWSGSVSLGLRYTNDVALDSSKLTEYRDLGVYAPVTGVELRGRGTDYYINMYGENLGRDDMYLDVTGGKYDVFKYRFYDNELRHTFGAGAGARSPYSGVGSSSLTATFPNGDYRSWQSFDHSYSRKDFGGMFEISARSPWYFRGEINEVKREGINVLAASLGTSPGNGFVDLPAPVDFKTLNYSGEVGYASKKGHFAVNLLRSEFSNGNSVLNWRNGFFGGTDTTTLAPENTFTRISANGNLRQLPGESTLAGRITHSVLKNEVSILTNMLSTGAINPSTASNSSTFAGNIKYTTAALSLSSHPLHDLDTRIYWNWAQEKNDSTNMVFSPTIASGLLGGASPNCSSTGSVDGSFPRGAVPCTPEKFGYKKQNFGAEAGYRVNPGNRLSAGVDFYDFERHRIDFERNIDRKVYGEWKNSSLDNLTARFKYQYMDRNSDWAVPGPVLTFNPTETYVRRFDLANVKQDLFKVVLDAQPMALLDLGLEAIYKKNNYKDTALGRTDDQRQEYYVSLSYGDADNFRVMIFGDIEFLEYNSTHRIGGTTFANSSPAAPPVGNPSTIYTWNAKNKDKSWQIGLGGDWAVAPRLSLKSSIIYAETAGTVDFAATGGATVLAPGFLSITNFDNTQRTAFNLKGVYQHSKQWELSGGYAFEKYRYSDVGYNNFNYVAPQAVGALNTQASYMTGQYAFQPYTANIVYAVAKYKFQ